MCIIASSEIGMNLPTAETIKTMWHRNSDGAGFMYNKDGKVVIKKGFMTLESFNQAIENLKNEIDVVNTAVVMHFRIGTHGGNTPENTHPFPITDTEILLKKISQNCDIGMAHNGIINTVKPRNNISDTMEYVLEFLASFKQIDRKFYKKELWQKIIENTINGSRMCFLNGEGEIEYIGNWETDEDGIKYSNSTYQSYSSKWYGKYSYSNWDWYDDYDDIGTCGAGLLEPESAYVSLLDEGYIVDEDGEMYDVADDNFLIDDKGYVYRYDYNFGWAVRMTGASAYTNAGLPAKYNENESTIIDWVTEDENEEYKWEYGYDEGYDEKSADTDNVTISATNIQMLTIDEFDDEVGKSDTDKSEQ